MELEWLFVCFFCLPRCSSWDVGPQLSLCTLCRGKGKRVRSNTWLLLCCTAAAFLVTAPKKETGEKLLSVFQRVRFLVFNTVNEPFTQVRRETPLCFSEGSFLVCNTINEPFTQSGIIARLV